MAESTEERKQRMKREWDEKGTPHDFEGGGIIVISNGKLRRHKMRKSQKDKIFRFMLNGQSVQPLMAEHRFGCMRLGARIKEIKDELKETGLDLVVMDKMTKIYRGIGKGKRVKRYWLEAVFA